MPANKVRGTTEEINTTNKRNYPGQHALVIERGIVRVSVSSAANSISVSISLKIGKLAYGVSCLPEDGEEEVESASDADKSQHYGQPLKLRIGFKQLF